MSAVILKGAAVAAAMNADTAERIAALRDKGVCPTLAVVRLGDRPDDIAYEKGIIKRCAGVGLELRQLLLPADCSEERPYDESEADDRVDFNAHQL